jgi:hypothetical protein
MLEEVCWKASREAGQKLFISALEQRDEEVVALANGENKGKVPRWLTTRLGHICFRREKVHGGNNGGSYPLDKAIGLRPRQKATQWVQMRRCELAAWNTYRPAADLMARSLKATVRRGRLWSPRWMPPCSTPGKGPKEAAISLGELSSKPSRGYPNGATLLRKKLDTASLTHKLGKR